MRALLFCSFYSVYIFLWTCVKISGEDQRLYLSTERPVITYVNFRYYSFLNFTTQRYGRRNPMYYVNMHFTTLYNMDNNLMVEFWFYEYYNSQYRRSFLEMNFKWCNLVYKDAFFGPAMRKNLPHSCPHKAGDYHLYNMTVSMSAMPSFPFTRGRIYANLTVRHEAVASGHIDMELKRWKNN